MKRMLLLLILLNCVILAQDDIFVLCEGNMGSNNASLWQFDEGLSSINGPVYWSVQNPLGDIGQSLTVDGDYLYLVLNNSNKIEVMDLSGTEPMHVKTIDVPYAGPRELVVKDDKAYIATYYAGILEYDLENDGFTDTLSLNGMPEYLLINQDKLFVSVNMKLDWSSDSTVVEVDLSSGTMEIDTVYSVVHGPAAMAVLGDSLYVSSTYYDASWNAWTGTSKINLSTGEVTEVVHGTTAAYSSDILVYDGHICRTLDSLVVPLNNQLVPQTEQAIAGIEGNVIYSMNVHNEKIYIGYTDDYVAPDYVSVFNDEEVLLNTFDVSACPGDFAFYSPSSSIDDAREIQTIAQKPQIINSYPNPFNPQTTIQFYLPKASAVKLSVFNIRGEKVEELANSQFTQGFHTVTWNAAKMASGAYFVLLQSGATMEMHKLLLLK